MNLLAGSWHTYSHRQKFAVVDSDYNAYFCAARQSRSMKGMDTCVFHRLEQITDNWPERQRRFFFSRTRTMQTFVHDCTYSQLQHTFASKETRASIEFTQLHVSSDAQVGSMHYSYCFRVAISSTAQRFRRAVPPASLCKTCVGEGGAALASPETVSPPAGVQTGNTASSWRSFKIAFAEARQPSRGPVLYVHSHCPLASWLAFPEIEISPREHTARETQRAPRCSRVQNKIKRPRRVHEGFWVARYDRCSYDLSADRPR